MTVYNNQLASADTYMNALAPDTNYGTDTTTTGIGEQNNAVGAIKRFLIQFDLSSIPSNAVVSAATLSLWILQDFSDNARTARMYRVLRNWTEVGATWNTYNGTNGWGTAGCGNSTTDYDGANEWANCAFTATETQGTQKDFVFGATGIAELQKFINGTYSNTGWMIKMDGEGNDAYLIYTSEEATQTARRPLLTVTYTVADTNWVVFF